MAIDQGTETVTLTSVERTWRLNIETANGTDPTFTVHRETIKTDPEGVVIARNQNAAVVTRAYSAVAAQEFVWNGITFSTQMIAEALVVMVDTWRQEDIDNPPAGPGPMRAPPPPPPIKTE